MSELKKIIFLKIRSKNKKKTENQCQNAACEQRNHKREMKIQTKN